MTPSTRLTRFLISVVAASVMVIAVSLLWPSLSLPIPTMAGVVVGTFTRARLEHRSSHSAVTDIGVTLVIAGACLAFLSSLPRLWPWWFLAVPVGTVAAVVLLRRNRPISIHAVCIRPDEPLLIAWAPPDLAKGDRLLEGEIRRETGETEHIVLVLHRRGQVMEGFDRPIIMTPQSSLSYRLDDVVSQAAVPDLKLGDNDA